MSNINNVLWVGFFFSNTNQSKLLTKLNKYFPENIRPEGSIHLSNLTQIHRMAAKKFFNSYKIIPENQYVTITVSSLVKNIENNSCAFRVDKIIDSNGNKVPIHTKKPHITAFVSQFDIPRKGLDYVYENNPNKVEIFKFKPIYLKAITKYMYKV